MHCSQCGGENPDGKRFCGDCGASLTNRCARCGADNPPNKKFCGDCGARLEAAAVGNRTNPISPPTFANETPYRDADDAIEHETLKFAAPSNVIEGERKMVTALFADIKGSMELLEDLDLEEARAIIDPALELMIAAAHRYDGYIVQSTGDGIFALFGAPVAHEDHPQRALYAALRMQEEMRRYAEQLRAERGVNLQVRVGVNTGEVVVRSIKTGAGQTEYTPIGHSTSLAARLQTLASPGSVVISDGVRILVEGYFQLKALGPARIKGVSEPVEVFDVVGLGPLRTRFQASGRRGLSKFVGRQREIDQMKRALELAKDGHGQIVAAVGEAGVGKSRLFFEFKAISQSGCLVLEALSMSHTKASAYMPVIELLKNYFEISQEDDRRKRRAKVTGKLLELDRTLDDTLPSLYRLLGLQEDGDLLEQMDVHLRQQRAREAIKRLLMRESLNQPLILVFEDLHWVDSETQALLDMMADGIDSARLLMLVNYRPEYDDPWSGRSFHMQFRLEPLGRESASEMLDALLGLDTMPAVAPPKGLEHGRNGHAPDAELAGLKRFIIEKTDGNPFFMEEMAQALVEQGILARDGAAHLTRPLTEIRIPTTVQGILTSRIDRLPAAQKELLQTLAVIGKHFPLALIKLIAGDRAGDLDGALSDLQTSEFIYEEPASDDVEYRFKHALTQEVAYNSMLIERRKLLHERIAAAIESLYVPCIEDCLGSLAHHYDRSGNIEKAIEYLQRAARKASDRAGFAEAVSELTHALELVGTLPDGAERKRRELDLRLELADKLFVLKGPAAEMEDILMPARELCREVGTDTQMLAILGLSRIYYFVRFELDKAAQLSELMLALSQQVGDPAMLVSAYFSHGQSALASGNLVGARADLEKALALCKQVEAQPAKVASEVAIAKGGSLSYLSWAEFALGYPELALTHANQAVEYNRHRSHAFGIAYANIFAAVLKRLTGHIAEMREHVETAVRVANEHGITMWTTFGTVLNGWLRAVVDGDPQGADEIKSAIANWKTSDSTPFASLLDFLVEACLACGRIAEGLAAADAMLSADAASTDQYAMGDMHRLRGQLLLVAEPPDPTEAEREFRTGLAIARAQRAKSWELRCATSLAGLLISQGRSDEARTLLKPIYDWFTEGQHTRDLMAAAQLLETPEEARATG